MKTVLLFSFLFVSCTMWAQKSLSIRPVFGALQFEKGKSYAINKDSVSVSTLKFYLSDICFFFKGKLIATGGQKYHLMSIDSGVTTLHFPTDKLQHADEIRFCIGVDSIQNADGAGRGDLDPANAMYWTWQSGYIDVKIEGKSTAFSSRNHVFEFHLGGFQNGLKTYQTCAFPLPKTFDFELVIDLQKFFTKMEVSAPNIMSPSPKAVAMAKHFASCFEIRQK